MNLLLLRNPRLSDKRLVELHESLELECAAWLHGKRDDRRQPEDPVAQRGSTRRVELGFDACGIVETTRVARYADVRWPAAGAIGGGDCRTRGACATSA